MYIYMYMYMYIYMYTYICMYMYTLSHIHTRTKGGLLIPQRVLLKYISLFTPYTHTYIYIYIYACLCIYILICTCMYTLSHTHTQQVAFRMPERLLLEYISFFYSKKLIVDQIDDRYFFCCTDFFVLFSSFL